MGAGGLIGLNVGIIQPTPGGGGGGASGELQVDDGTYYGYTDFSEYEVAAGLPSGITESWNRNGTVSAAHSIGLDGSEGNYLQSSISADSGFDYYRGIVMSLDAWDPVAGNVATDEIEMLARVYLPLATDGNFSGAGAPYVWGPSSMISMPSGNYASAAGEYYRQVQIEPNYNTESYLLRHQRSFNSTSSDQSYFDTKSPPNYDTIEGGWAWIRARWTRSGTTTANKSRMWTGAIGDEPGTWDVDSNSTRAYTSLGRIGWAAGCSYRVHPFQRIAYLGFTTNFSAVPVPTP